MEPPTPTTDASSISHHQLTMKRDAATIIWVNTGSSVPKLLKMSSNCGTTHISSTELTRSATTMTIAG